MTVHQLKNKLKVTVMTLFLFLLTFLYTLVHLTPKEHLFYEEVSFSIVKTICKILKNCAILGFLWIFPVKPYFFLL